MALKSNTFIVIIPVFNEELIIEKSISKIVEELIKIPAAPSILIVNDGSTDDTPWILRMLRKRYPKKIKIINHNKNKGYGQAVQTGITFCIKEKIKYALFMDSDLTNNPKDIKKFVSEIKHDYDCVKASRYTPGGKVTGVPQRRILISRTGNLFASFLFRVGVKDVTNGYLMVRANMFKGIKLKEKGFAVIMEEMYYLKKRKAKFKEIPVILKNRKTGKTHFSYSIKTFYAYMKYPIRSII